jgi:hypothetical protein
VSPRAKKGTIATRSIGTDTALAKLARILEVEPSEVDFLADLRVESLRELRWEISDTLNAADAKRLAGVMAASKLVPIGVAATIGEKWFGPVLCARLVGLVDPGRGGQYVKHLSVPFMADITTRTDPRVVGDLVHELDLQTMQQIAATLLERGDHLTLSHFVGHLPASVVAAILEAIDDNAVVVRVARYVEELDHLDPVVALLPGARIVDLVHAVDDADLWVDALHLFSHLGDAQITRSATTIVRQDTEVVTAAIKAFDRHDLWEASLQLVDHLDPADIAAFADVLLVLDDDLIDAAVDVIDRIGAWPTLVRIALAADGLEEPERARLRTIVERLPTEQLAAFESAAAAAGHPALLTRVLSPRAH